MSFDSQASTKLGRIPTFGRGNALPLNTRLASDRVGWVTPQALAAPETEPVSRANGLTEGRG
jgi:hypothetical protein